jgi:hypothetical protein
VVCRQETGQVKTHCILLVVHVQCHGQDSSCVVAANTSQVRSGCFQVTLFVEGVNLPAQQGVLAMPQHASKGACQLLYQLWRRGSRAHLQNRCRCQTLPPGACQGVYNNCNPCSIHVIQPYCIVSWPFPDSRGVLLCLESMQLLLQCWAYGSCRGHVLAELALVQLSTWRSAKTYPKRPPPSVCCRL